MKEILLRVLLGGAFVSAFAIIGEVLKPKQFAGIFGAAPSIALATLALTAHTQGKTYAAIEARSMIGGGVALFVYSLSVNRLLTRLKWPALTATLALLPVWLVTAFGIWLMFLR